MKRADCILIAVVVLAFSAAAKAAPDGEFKLALSEHRGQLSWSAAGFNIVQSSAKSGGREIGIRGKDQSGRLGFLGFLFLFSDQAPLTSAKCRDGVLDPEKKSNKTLKILATQDVTSSPGPPVSVVTYTSEARGKTAHMVRGFVADGDICGDLEIYSDSPIAAGDADVKNIFASYHLDKNYSPQFSDVFLYAQILYDTRMYKAAAPIFEIALAKIKENPASVEKTLKDAKTATRVVTDQAGMAYGMSGDIPKARALFERAIRKTPTTLCITTISRVRMRRRRTCQARELIFSRLSPERQM